MVKDILKYAAVAVSAVLMGQSFTSCSNGDDGGGSSDGNPNAGTVKTAEGTKYRVTKAGNYSYTYNSEGKLSYINLSSYDGYKVSYSPFKMELVDKYSSDGTQVMENIRVNGNGYITGLKETVTESNYGSNSNVSFSYDGNGHLARMTVSASGWEIYNGKKETYNGTRNISFTWDGGKLTKITGTYSGAYDDESETIEFYYEKNSEDNPLCQYTPNILNHIIEDMASLSCIGYLGKGPSALPSKCVVTDKSEGSSKSHTTYFTYNVSSTGLVQSYTSSSTRYYMEYSTVSDYSSK